jgi:Ca-activated chloride channel family protein
MRAYLAAITVVLVGTAAAQANGLLIPEEKKLPPLAMLSHQVSVAIDDQVAVTEIEQVFRNHTDRPLEAIYVFPVPKGASVRKFSMWVDGKEKSGELVGAAKAKEIYTDVLRRTQDPGLLEYMDHNLFRVQVFPIPAHGDQRIKLSFTSVAQSDNDLIEYVYPLKTDGKATRTLEKFSLTLNLKSQHSIHSIYSPTHSITLSRPSDRQAIVTFEKDQALLDKDFQLLYTTGGKDVGLTALTHRPNPDGPGYFLLLASPRAELSKDQQLPRDMVFVLDTSGSMEGKRLQQAKGALNYLLGQLGPNDRFALMNFATVVNRYNDELLPATSGNIEQARKWVNKLKATGGTAIDDALTQALELRSNESERTFTVIFFTDGRPTVGELNPDKILAKVAKNNTANTRIFTFGVGDDVNATLLDRLAEESRAVATYVREAEDIEVKVSGLYQKISNPVLTNLKLSVGSDISISEVYPPHLPDLFHGSQLVILGRYAGKGHAAITLTGNAGKVKQTFVYEANFQGQTGENREFVEDLWARRKVGYLLDQIRVNGEKKELVDEVISLAKRYGIATPYTSFLIVPDVVLPVAQAPLHKSKPKEGKPDVSFNLIDESPVPPGLQAPGGGPKSAPMPVTDFIKKTQLAPGDADKFRFGYLNDELNKAPAATSLEGAYGVYARAMRDTKDRWDAQNQCNTYLKNGKRHEVQEGKLGVDLSCEYSNLRNQTRLTRTATQRIGDCNVLEVGGVWIDERYTAKMQTVTVKAMSNAYFKMLDVEPSLRNVFRLGNHLVFVTPSGTALVLDAATGREEMTEAEIRQLFVKK